MQALIVEDQIDSAEVVSRVLHHHDIPHAVAHTAEEALTMLEEVDPDVLIVDLALPGMDGWQFLEAVRSDAVYADVIIVAVTAFHSTNVAKEAIAAGFDAYFAKPIDVTSFVEELERLRA